MVSAPSPPNSCIVPMAVPPSEMLSFSLPPLTVPVLPARRTTLSLPESPVTVARPEPVRIWSSPARPTMVPGPLSPDWFKVSLPAVPVAEYAIRHSLPVVITAPRESAAGTRRYPAERSNTTPAAPRASARESLQS